MLDQTLVALASAAGAAVASAAGTDAWQGLRQQVARIFGRGDRAAEQTLLERLDRSVVDLEQADSQTRELARAQVVAAWQARFHDLLEDADDTGRPELTARLEELVRYARRASGSASAGDGGFTVAGGVDIRADRGSAAAGVMGHVTFGNPRLPGPGQN
ncbi:hypothetical protein ABZ372_27405 [Streptomyces sp. NPDC005921]|uniref:hypothetical protein n=1 Tax=Streptomyces sp. NPDC005827 TaxID=3157070 RepID=UPI0033F6C937